MTKPANETSPFPDKVYKALLKKFKNELETKLKGYYVWPFPLDSLSGMGLAKCVKKELEKFKDNRARLTLEAKSRFSKILSKQDDATYLKIAKWIVREWGKINSVPKDDSLNKLREIITQNNKPDEYAGVIGFDGISSLSKIASFLDCDKYPVYDSRVAFTLNWLIFTEGWHEKDGGKMKFFRQPAARNGDMDIHDQETIFNLAYENFAVGNEFYYHSSKTYEMYCRLLKGTCDCSKKCWNKGISIGELEMCLFAIAAKNKKSKVDCKYNKYITDEMDEKLKPSLIKPLRQLHPLYQLRGK